MERVEDFDARDRRRFAFGCVGVLLLPIALVMSLFFLACPRGICLAAGGHPAEMYAHSVDVCDMPEGSPCPRFFGPRLGVDCAAEGWVALP